MATKKTASKPEAEQAAPKKPAVGVLRKISVATVYGKVKIADIPEDETLKICRIAGVASGVESGESSYGDWECLTGEFAATNYATGEVFAGAKAFVPGALGEALQSSMRSALAEDVGSRLKFCVDVSVSVSARDANKYEYRVSPVMETDVKNEALALLGYTAE